MKNVRVLFALLLLCGSVAFAQTSDSPASSSPAPVSSLAELFKPSMTSLVDTVNNLQVDKWKLSKEGREQLNSYLSSMQRDVNETLPGLVNTADASPEVPNLIAVSQNTGALYDVLVRVAATSELAAPQQANALNQVAIQLRDARRRLDDAILKQVVAQKAQVTALQNQLNQANLDLQAAKATAAQNAQNATQTTKKTTKKKKTTSQ